MIKFSEYVSIGHPDKIADYISQYLLDRYIERDPQTRYAVEVQIKDWQVTLGGEVSSTQHFSAQGLTGWGDQGIFFGYCEYRPKTCTIGKVEKQQREKGQN